MLQPVAVAVPTELSRLDLRISAVKKCGIEVRSSSGPPNCDHAVGTSCPHTVTNHRFPTILAVHFSGALPLKSAVGLCFVKIGRSFCEDNFISKSSAALQVNYHMPQKLSVLSRRRVKVIRDLRLHTVINRDVIKRIVHLGVGLRGMRILRGGVVNSTIYHKFQ